MNTQYCYTSPDQMTPMLPSAGRLDALRSQAAALIAAASAGTGANVPYLATALRDELRAMNAYYSNRIEGLLVDPLLIEAARSNAFESRPEVALKQRLAIAHIDAERYAEANIGELFGGDLFRPSTVQALHRRLYEPLQPEERSQADERGWRALVVPGGWRTQGVKVGTHVPPDPAEIPRFMGRWHDAYCRHVAGESALFAILAAHHRLAWIHPFADGNGRTARLHTQMALHALGLTQGLWSPTRGLALHKAEYRERLVNADLQREGDLDGRGNLSEKRLVEWIEFVMRICTDQVTFMASRPALASLGERLRMFLAAEGESHRFQQLRTEAAAPILFVCSQGPISRAQFKQMTGLAERTAERVLADVLKVGLLASKTPKGQLEIALNAYTMSGLFRQVWPELDAQIEATRVRPA